MKESLFDIALGHASTAAPIQLRGFVTDVTGVLVEGAGISVPVGAQVTIDAPRGALRAQVVGFKKDKVLLMPFGEMEGVGPGAPITASSADTQVLVSEAMLGCVLNAFGDPIDGSENTFAKTGVMVPLYRKPPNPVTRRRINTVFDCGVRAINSMLTLGVGQRMAIMAGSGVGKSTLMGMIAKHAVSDINVIALVGERGREVREFIERDLGEEGLKRSILIVATGDDSPLVRIRAAFYATAVAEYFRDKGKKVVLMMDSVTRLAMAQREIGLAIGEPPSTKGYTPSVFSMLPKLLERAGTTSGEGSITGLYTVLVEGDDMNEPVADTVRGILDGHMVLSRRLASKAQYPAIEVLHSVSRVMTDIVSKDHLEVARRARESLSLYQENEDLITIGAYKTGQSARLDDAIKVQDKLVTFLKQTSDEHYSVSSSIDELGKVFA